MCAKLSHCWNGSSDILDFSQALLALIFNKGKYLYKMSSSPEWISGFSSSISCVSTADEAPMANPKSKNKMELLWNIINFTDILPYLEVESRTKTLEDWLQNEAAAATELNSAADSPSSLFQPAPPSLSCLWKEEKLLLLPPPRAPFFGKSLTLF